MPASSARARRTDAPVRIVMGQADGGRHGASAADHGGERGRRGMMPRWLANVLVLSCSVALSLAAIEVLLRCYFYGRVSPPNYSAGFLMPDASIGWRLRPNASSRHQELDFDVPVTINSKGLREPERPYAKDPRTLRILLVSDSATFASGVTVEQSLPSLLASGLGNGVEVVNFAVPAYSTVQELLLFREEGWRYQPDLVILALSPVNDIQTNFAPLQVLYQRSLRRPYARLEDSRLIIDNTHADAFRRKHDESSASSPGPVANHVTVRLFKHVWRQLFPDRKPDPNVFLGWPFLRAFAPELGSNGLSAADYTARWEEGWRTTQALILALKSDAEAVGARFCVFASPAKIQGDERFRSRILAAFPGLQLDVHRFNRELETFGAEHGIPVLDPLAAIEEAASQGERLYFDIEDEHLTAKAHAVIARALVPQLAAEGGAPSTRRSGPTGSASLTPRRLRCTLDGSAEGPRGFDRSGERSLENTDGVMLRRQDRRCDSPKSQHVSALPTSRRPG